MGFPEAEAPELSGHRQARFRRLALVHRQQHRHLLTAQPFGDRFIGGGEALLTIGDHHGHGGFRQGEVGLLADLRQEFAVVVEDETAGIDHLEMTIAPEAVLVGAIAGHTGFVVHDRLTAAAQTIHKGGFAHVGAANDGDDGQSQRFIATTVVL